MTFRLPMWNKSFSKEVKTAVHPSSCLQWKHILFSSGVLAWVPDLSHRVPPLGTLVRDVWESQAKIPYCWRQNYPDLVSGSDWFLPKNTWSTLAVNMGGRELSNEKLEGCLNTVSEVQNTQSVRTASRCPSSWQGRFREQTDWIGKVFQSDLRPCCRAAWWRVGPIKFIRIKGQAQLAVLDSPLSSNGMRFRPVENDRPESNVCCRARNIIVWNATRQTVYMQINFRRRWSQKCEENFCTLPWNDYKV